jgi:hypothetical protein
MPDVLRVERSLPGNARRRERAGTLEDDRTEEAQAP